MVSHNLNDVFEVADRIAVLRLGRMVAAGPASDFDPQIGRRLHDHGTIRPGAARRRIRARSRRKGGPRVAKTTETPGRGRGRRRRAADATARRRAGDGRRAHGQQPPGVRPRLGGRGCAPVESGVLPVVLGLFLISVIFQSLNSNFLTAGNIVNLLVQGAVYMLLAMAEVFVLLLGEIDLSAGFVGGVGGIIAAELVTSEHGSWSWWAACIAALLVCAADRRVHGHDHHAPRPAVVRRHAGRAPRVPGRDAAHPRQRRHAAHQRQRHQRLRQRAPHAGGGLDRDGGRRRPVRGDHVDARCPPAPAAGSWRRRSA